jgi:hypothetical protein
MTANMGDMRTRLSILWVFVSLNYLYGNVSESFSDTMVSSLTWVFSLVFAILLETPIAMVVLSRILKYRANRLANIVVGAVNYFTSFSLLVVGVRAWPLPRAPFLVFPEVMVIVALSLVIWYAWKWPKP